MDNDKTSRPNRTKRNWSLLEEAFLQKYPSLTEASLAAENKEKELAGLFHEFHKIGISEKDLDKAAKREIGQKIINTWKERKVLDKIVFQTKWETQESREAIKISQ